MESDKSIPSMPDLRKAGPRSRLNHYDTKQLQRYVLSVS